jgi:arginase
MNSNNNILLIENNLGNTTNIGINRSIEILKKYIKKYKISSQTAISNNSSIEKKLFYNLINIYNNIQDERIFIGGDHSSAIATISKIYYPGMKIIWIDAHPDINTYKESISKNYHGMPLAVLTGLDRILNSALFDIKIPFSDILYIGIRSIDDFERKIIEEKNIKFIDSNLTNYKEIIKDFLGNNKFHISFDVDSIVPYDMPCTGTRVENGITRDKMRELMDYLLVFKPNSLDIVEINLTLGSYYQYHKSIATLFYVFENYNIFSTNI